MAPNCYLEVKGPEGSAAVARRQACYDGAIGARGMLSLHSYGKETMIYDNRAYTISSTYYDQMYATHFTPPTDAEKPPEYQMTYLGAWALTGSREQSQHGAAAFRNGEMSLSPSRVQKRDHQASNRPGTAAPQNSQKVPRWGF